MDFYWLIPVVAIGGGITYAIMNSYFKSKSQMNSASPASPELQVALEANTAASRAILERLDRIDARLGAVEKTLTDIP